MLDLDKIDQPTLVDMLADETAHFTRLLQEKNRTEEYQRVKAAIKELTIEIKSRQPLNPTNGFLFTTSEGAALK